MRKNELRPYGWMVCGSLSFTFMGTLAHELKGDCPWQLIAMARSGVAFVLAALLTRAAGARFVLWRPGIIWVRSIAGSVSLVCTFFALTRLPVSDVLTVTNMFPIWVAMLSWPMLGEVPSRSVWLTAACGVAGVALIQEPHFAHGQIDSAAALVVASFATAFAMIGLHRLADIDTRAVVAHFSAVAVVFCVLAALFLKLEPAPQWEWRTLWLLLGVGLTATVGQLCLTKAFFGGAPAKVSVFGLTQIIFAMPLEILIAGRQFTTQTLLGIVLVLAPTAWLLATAGKKQRAERANNADSPSAVTVTPPVAEPSGR